MSTSLSAYQQDIIDFVSDEDEAHGVALAYAGSGKTFILRKCAEAVDEDESMLFCAFNRVIRDALQEKIRRGNTDILTLHQLGYRALREQWKRFKPKLDDNYLHSIVETLMPRTAKEEDRTGVRTLAENAMKYAVTDDASLQWLMNRFDTYPSDRSTPDAFYVTNAQKVLKRLLEPSATICFGQMLFVAAYNNWRTGSYRRVFVDEMQDMNRAQRIVARQALSDHGRLFAVGDENQAIYEWNGAEADSIRLIISELEAKVFKLPISYRAPEAVAAHVRDFIPDFVARPGANKGSVETVDTEFMMRSIQAGDMYLSRKNAPLPKVCLNLLANATPAYIRGGADITKPLFDLVRRSKKSDIKDFLFWLSEWTETKVQRLLDTKQEKKTELVYDLRDTLRELSEDLDTTEELVELMEKLFIDATPDDKVCCSNVHKAKGTETAPGRAVWLDMPTFRTNDDAEKRLKYVADTRTQDKLYFVWPEKKVKK